MNHSAGGRRHTRIVWGPREIDLLTRARRDGDAGAMEELVRRMMPLARRVARRYSRSVEPLDDLEQVASFGLLGALRRFDPHRGTDFCAYAVASIDGELKHYHRDRCWSTRVPRRAKERALILHRERERLQAALGRSPSQDELLAGCGGTRDQLLDASWAHAARSSLSFEADQALPLPDVAEAGYQRVEDEDEFTYLLNLLPAAERRIVFLRFRHELTQQEIGERVGISQMHVSRVLRRALDRLAAAVAY
jgi:RNA polymerase sigma-B factor